MNRRRLAKYVLMSLLLTVVSAWCLRYDSGELNRFEMLALWMGSLLFGSGVLLFSYLAFKRPQLVLGADGILDRTSPFAKAGPVQWADIEDARIGVVSTRYYRSKVLCLSVRDPEKYLKRHGPIGCMLARANARYTGYPVTITLDTLAGLDGAETNLAERVRRRAAESR
ncbi:STM3941 family protein [Caballeronia novacaledonica]|uniref:STM3941 family protein n=1 Tax=Caballeronia novacaledonica TaxID=1544861 RepID=UPI00283AA93A|nr:STM3941 family protein [Caballeronia novacaledonica]